jgi:sirohydrochlorin ferrochelatase
MTIAQACRTGLVLISHGSPSQPWNQTMERVADSVKKVLGTRSYNPFQQVKLAHLEFAKPDIAEVCESFETAGCDRIVAYPLFISVSSHSDMDIPNALNIRYHDHSDSEIRRYTGRLPVTLTSPMDHGPILPKMVSECASEISKNPESESAIILSHGGGCEHFWEHMHRRVAMSVTERTGIKDVKWLGVQTGRSPRSQDKLVNAINEILKNDASRRILILSCFGGLSGSQFIERINQGLQKRHLPTLPSSSISGCSGWINRDQVIEEIANVAQRAAAAASGHSLPNENGLHALDEYPPYNPPYYLTRDRPDRTDRSPSAH